MLFFAPVAVALVLLVAWVAAVGPVAAVAYLADPEILAAIMYGALVRPMSRDAAAYGMAGAFAKVQRRFIVQAAAKFSGQSPKAETTLYNTPSQLFTPAVVTAKNLKAEVVDKGITSAKELCTGRYAEGCKKLGIGS